MVCSPPSAQSRACGVVPHGLAPLSHCVQGLPKLDALTLKWREAAQRGLRELLVAARFQDPGITLGQLILQLRVRLGDGRCVLLTCASVRLTHSQLEDAHLRFDRDADDFLDG